MSLLVQGESLASVSTSREGGPVITKWEQLNLAPDLLRSLNTFGYVTGHQRVSRTI